MSAVNLTYKISLQKFRSNAFAKPINRRIRVKIEPGIQRNRHSNAKKSNGKVNVVKVELNSPRQRIEAISSQEEKQTLINKIVSLKTENQQLAFQLRSEQSEKTSLKSEMQKMARQINTQSTEITTLRSKLSDESAKYTEMKSQNEMKISDLMRKNDVLDARNKQLQKGVNQQAVAEKQKVDENDDEVYEVDKLLNHTTENGVRFYLVRWKGYSMRHDTWEKESNLDCPKILSAYNATIANKKK